MTPEQSKQLKQAVTDEAKKETIKQVSKATSGQKAKEMLGYGTTGAGLGSFGGPIGIAIGGTVGLAVGAVAAYWDDMFVKPKQGNNSDLRKELDKFEIPADFDQDKYYSQRPDVAKWANGLGLNSPDYVKKMIVYHWFLHGNAEGHPYPYKKGSERNEQLENYFRYMAQKPVEKGTFDWKGAQVIDGKSMVGFHTNNDRPNLKKGDTVKVIYRGFTHTSKVVQMGADDGSHLDSMFVFDLSPQLVPQTIGDFGTWEKVTTSSEIVTTAALGIGSLLSIYLIAKKWIF